MNEKKSQNHEGPQVQVTEQAARELRRLQESKPGSTSIIRLFISGYG